MVELATPEYLKLRLIKVLIYKMHHVDQTLSIDLKIIYL